MRRSQYTVQELKEMGREKALQLKDKLEDENCNLDYTVKKDHWMMMNNNDTIHLINQIYVFKEL